MALSCQPDTLAQLAKCLKCLSGTTLVEAQVYLLCLHLG
jgi:hypothetical protein